MINNFQTNVFINCPFDDKYRSLLKPLLFTIRYCGLNPRIASERMDSSEVRLDKIIEIIKECQLSIHDLSRIKSSQADEYYRLNMPLEIGLDMGCKYFHGDAKYADKKLLILEGERFSIHKALSDLSGTDVKCHDQEAEKMVECVRTWFAEIGMIDVAGPNLIWDDYNIFNFALYEDCLKRGFKKSQIDKLSMPEFFAFLQNWMEAAE